MQAQLFQAVLLPRQYMGRSLVGAVINLFYGTIDKQPVATAKTALLPGEPEVLLHKEVLCFVSNSISCAYKNTLLTIAPVSIHVLGCEVPTFPLRYHPAASQGPFHNIAAAWECGVDKQTGILKRFQYEILMEKSNTDSFVLSTQVYL